MLAVGIAVVAASPSRSRAARASQSSGQRISVVSALQVALDLVGCPIEVLASGLAAAPAGREGPELVRIAVVVEREADEAHRACGQQQRPERPCHHQAREALRQRIGQRAARGDRAHALLQAALVVGAVGTRALGAGLDPLQREAARHRLLAGLERVEVEEPKAQTAAEVVVGLGVGLVAHRLGRAERRQQAGLGELGERGVDGAAPEIGKLPRGARVDLVGGQVLPRAGSEREQDRAPLRRAAQPELAQHVADVGGSSCSSAHSARQANSAVQRAFTDRHESASPTQTEQCPT